MEQELNEIIENLELWFMINETERARTITFLRQVLSQEKVKEFILNYLK